MRRILSKYKKENLEIMVKASKSIAAVLSKLEVVPTGSSYATLKRYINVYRIDTSHFIKQGDVLELNRLTGKIRQKRPIEDILRENVNYNTARLKRRLIREGLKKDICEECGQNNIWFGKKITLILDHKNGIRTDFRLINLRVACPNCAATFDTHCRGVRKKKIKIRTKRKKPSKTIAWEKARIKNRKVERPNYFILRTDVYKLGYSATGRKYGVSDNTIRKWIKNYEKNGF